MTPAPPRIVFFGPPHAGKTALLSAFLRLADAPAPADTPGPRDVVSHAVQPLGCVLVDTDGTTAANLIAHPERFRPRAVRREPSSVTAAVYAADALVLLVDASADDDALGRLFGEFRRFLDKLEDARTAGREVGGLTVFLTLTKCDTLYRPGDTPDVWLRRIEAREKEVRARFEEFEDDRAAGDFGPLAFGSVGVEVAATALKFPDAPGFDSLGDGLFGVVDLFQKSTAAAAAFRGRAERSARRLRWTLGGAGGVLTAMAVAAAVLVAGRGPDDDPLTARVRAFREAAGPPAVRLADRHFAANEAELESIRAAPRFDSLPAELRKFVEDELTEFAAYKEYRGRFRPPRLGPADVRSRGELDALTAALSGELAPPREYTAAWAQTEAGLLRAKWAADAALLKGAEEALYEWYRGLVRRATALELAPAADARWREEATALAAADEKPPFRPDDPFPDSPRVSVRRGAPLTHAPAFEFDRVALARQDWEAEKARLLALRGLSDALGLTGASGILALPDPPAEVNPGDVLRRLREAYPSPAGDYREWALPRFADPLRGELRGRLDRAFAAGVRQARVLIAAKKPHTPGWLETDPVLADWGRLLALLRRVADPDTTVPDPVAELAAFLKKDRFDADVRSVELTVPDDLRGRRAVPAGLFTITVGTAVYRFRPDGEPRRDGPATVVRYTPDGHAGTFTLRPSDDVTADAAFKAGDVEFRLVWTGERGETYTFDRLSREPEVRGPDRAATGERANGVRLVSLPEGGWPAVPVLLPSGSRP